MADNTHIEWADATVNAVNGCSVTSPGCTNCYAMRLAGTRLKHHASRAGLTQPSKAGPVWTGEVRLDEKQLLQPLRWRRPRKIFWNAHGDLFHENVPDAWIDRVFAVCALTPQHTHMILTKRSARMLAYMTKQSRPDKYITIADDGSEFPTPESMWRVHSSICDLFAVTPPSQLNFAAKSAEEHGADGFMHGWPLPNVWLGTSVEDQARADERIPHLLATPAAKRFLSCEPLLGAIMLCDERLGMGAPPLAFLDWIIVGGESGPGARPMHPDWARSLRDQCRAAGVAVFVKQLSSGGPKAIKDIAAFPEGLRVREFPNG